MVFARRCYSKIDKNHFLKYKRRKKFVMHTITVGLDKALKEARYSLIASTRSKSERELFGISIQSLTFATRTEI